MRILSGIQPTGDKHIGNHIGAIRHYVDMQDLGDTTYFVADLHALTMLPDPATVRESTLATATMLLAAGVDPERSTVFVQSHLGAQHAQLAWLLDCIATFGELRRMTQFKDKCAAGGGESDGVSLGLFAYPVLQAADVLAHDADQVPVGEDQKQHLELVRNIAQRFNSRYGETFTVPQPRIAPVAGRVMDLQDPTRKMSTTGGTAKGTVYVLDPPETVAKKFRSAVTDSGSEVRHARADKPGVSNLLDLMSVATGRGVDALAAEYAGGGYGAFKTAAGEAMVEYLRPVRERYALLAADRPEVERVLASGADAARERAAAALQRAADRMGLLPPAR